MALQWEYYVRGGNEKYGLTIGLGRSNGESTQLLGTWREEEIGGQSNSMVMDKRVADMINGLIEGLS